MPKKKLKWHWLARRSNESTDVSSPKAPQGLPDPVASPNPSIRIPQRPKSRHSDASNTRSSAPAAFATGNSLNISRDEARDRAGSVSLQLSPHNSTQDEGLSSVHAEKKDYWQLALDELQKEDSSIKGQVDAVQRAAAEAGNADFATQLLRTTQQEQEELESKRWKISVGSRKVVLRDHFDRLVKAITFIKEISNAIGNVDPVHAGLPLAGFCVLFSVSSIVSVASLR